VPRADEGFWPYNSIPKAAIKKKFGFELTDAWLNHLQLATVRFGGATGSLVSPNGLVMTNHHVTLGSLQRLSTKERDLVKNGFVATSYDEELKVPGMTLSVLQGIEDVTARVTSAVMADMNPNQAVAARAAAIGAIETEATTPGTTGQVVTLYAGAVYNLYRYKVYDDVRLVFGVEYQTGFYGGDPDNFTYPRYNLDLGMFRLYENGKPVSTPNYLRWSPNGSREGELVFTTGHPGATQRLNTYAHVEYRRDVTLPYSIAMLEMREATLRKWMALSAENARQSAAELYGIRNGLKSQRWQLKGLQDPAVLAKKAADEKRLRAELAKNADKQKELGDAWDVIARTITVARELDNERNFIVNASGINSQLFNTARAIVRAQSATAIPAADIDIQREKINLTESLAFMAKYLGADHEIVKLILAGKTPEARANELIDTCRMQDREIVNLLQAGGKATVDVSTDPMIVLARALEPRAQAVTKRLNDEVLSVQANAYPKIGRAAFAVYGASAYPDATGSLRLSYGTVKGYMEDGRKVAPYTDLAGLYARTAQHNGESPYDLAPRWVDAKNLLNLKTPFNMVTTNDIVGGSSGSPMVNKKGEIVGLIFDGNLQMLPGYFVYEDSTNRAVAVDSRAILETLEHVYKAQNLVQEIGRKK
jgi:V8-like Glu-specific endopeptidase